jgi:hypothetical protein
MKGRDTRIEDRLNEGHGFFCVWLTINGAFFAKDDTGYSTIGVIRVIRSLESKTGGGLPISLRGDLMISSWI